MKKLIVLCSALVLSLAMLAGCNSADPNNPYDPNITPAPMNEEAAAVAVEIVDL